MPTLPGKTIKCKLLLNSFLPRRNIKNDLLDKTEISVLCELLVAMPDNVWLDATTTLSYCNQMQHQDSVLLIATEWQ